VNAGEIHLQFDAGTLVIDGIARDELPDSMDSLATWDPRILRYRAEAYRYRDVFGALTRLARAGGHVVHDAARTYQTLALNHRVVREPFEHERDALAQWRDAGQRGIAVLPTGAGKTFVAEMAIALTRRSTLVVVPTIDLMQQWYDVLTTAFGQTVGLMGGGEHDLRDVTVATYDSAAIHVDRHGGRFGLIIFDECHHLPSPGYLVIAEHSIAPFRLGLTATLARSDGRESLLDDRVGPVVCERGIRELAGEHLAEYDTVRLRVRLATDEAERYRTQRETYRAFVVSQGIRMTAPDGWQQFIQRSSRSPEGRRAFLAYREQRQIAVASSAKLAVLEGLLRQHARDRAIVFTNDNDTVYLVSRMFLLPALTHQTEPKERREILGKFSRGEYPTIVTSRVLNEGVDVPEANVAIVLSGTGSVREHVQRLGRILRRREGKRATLYEVITEGTIEEQISDRRRDHDAYM